MRSHKSSSSRRPGKIKDVNVSFAAEHNVIADLSFFLESPTGRLVHLTSGNGGIGDGYGSQNVDGCGSTTTFNDEPTSTSGTSKA